VVGELRSALDELAGEQLGTLDGAALGAGLVELRRAIDRLEADWLRRLAEFDRREAWRKDGALSPTSWLRIACRLAPGAARERVTVAERLERLPVTRTAFAAGEVSYGHVRLLAAAATDERRDAFARSEQVLVDAARQLDPGRLRVVLAHWRHAVDPDGALEDANACHERRRLYASVTYEGTVALDGELDPEGGATLLTALDAVRRDGLDPLDTRTPAQRRADALVELARRALDAGELPDHGGERPHVTVTVDLATLRRQPGCRAGELEPTGPVCAETARRLACDAGVSRVVTAGDSQPLDVGRRTRVVSPALRRALVWRDRGCRFPGCDRPPAWTDRHHLVHWADGGPTSLDNLVLLCRRHHRIVHETGYRLETGGPDGGTVKPPGGWRDGRAPPWSV
jgi:hypothetical protein